MFYVVILLFMLCFMSSLFFFFIMHRGWDEREMQFRPSVCLYIQWVDNKADSDSDSDSDTTLLLCFLVISALLLMINY